MRYERTLLKGCPHGVFNHLIDELLVLELYLMLLRMNVHIHSLRIKAEMEHKEWVFPIREQGLVRRGHRVTERSTDDWSAVQEQELLATCRAGQRRRSDKTLDHNTVVGKRHLEQGRCALVAIDGKDCRSALRQI